MATRTVNHAAAIFADMSVDGPVIGTLVAVIDRAKNLPNVSIDDFDAVNALTPAQEESNGQAGSILRCTAREGSQKDQDRQTRRPDPEVVRNTAKHMWYGTNLLAGTRNSALQSTTRPTTTASRYPYSTTIRRRSSLERHGPISTESSHLVGARATTGTRSIARANTRASSASSSPTTTRDPRPRSRWQRRGESRRALTVRVQHLVDHGKACQ